MDEKEVAGVAGLEPATPGFGVVSIPLLPVSFCFAAFRFVPDFAGVLHCFDLLRSVPISRVSDRVVYFLCTCVLPFVWRSSPPPHASRIPAIRTPHARVVADRTSQITYNPTGTPDGGLRGKAP
jgi:hypothetical protein